MTAYAALANKKDQLIRKGLQGSVFLADTSAATITPAALFGAAGALQALPTGWADLGLTTEDGAVFSRSVSTNEIKSWGSTSPTRTDVTGDTTTMKVTAQETSKATIALFTGADPSTMTRDTHGAVEIQKPAIANPRHYRVLSMAVDENNSGEIYLCRYLPYAKVTDFGDQAFSNSDAGMLYPVTFTGYKDATVGFSESWLFGGPGWNALLTDMGFTALP